MKAYILPDRHPIEPFPECARDLLIANKTLAQWQADVLQSAGFSPVTVSNPCDIFDDNAHIIVADNLYFSPRLLADFVAKAKTLGTVAACALKLGVTTLRTAISVQEVKLRQDHAEYNLRYFPESGHRGECRTVTIEPDEFVGSIPMPLHMCGQTAYPVPMTDTFAIQIDHWANLWVANIVALLSEAARLRRCSKLTLAILALKARSLNKWKIARVLNTVGRNSDVHPTAYVEGSVLGEGVTVGAKAVIRESVIGDNTLIGNGVVVEQSVIGERCTVLNGHILYSVLYPSAFSVAEMVSASLLGRETFMGLNATVTDFRFDGTNVTILKNGAVVDSGNTFLGSCLGHKVYLGSGCIVPPGRAIPCGLRIAQVCGKARHEHLPGVQGWCLG